MKSYFFALTIIAFSSGQLSSQSTKTTIKRTYFTVQVDENTIVRDSAGERVPYAVAVKLIAKGEFTLDPVRDKSQTITEYKLRPLKVTDAGKREVALCTPATANLPKPVIGDTLPAFTVYTMDSLIINKDLLKGKVVVFNFWFSMCKPCLYEMPAINEMARSYKSNPDIIFIAAKWEKRETVAKFLENVPSNYVQCAEAFPLIDALKIRAYPTHIVVGKDGRICNSYSGGLPGMEDVLKKDIEEALKQENCDQQCTNSYEYFQKTQDPNKLW